MGKILFMKKQILILFYSLMMGSFIFGQTGWSIDQSFSPHIVKTRDFFFRIAKSSGKYYFAQDLDKKTLKQMNSDGTINSNYSIVTNGNILAIVEAQNSKTYVGGDFTSASNVFAPKIIRLNSDGTRDISFLPDSNSQNVNVLQELADGKLLVGRDNSIQRLNADGTTDISFSTVTTNGIVQTFAVLPNGKILVGGLFTTVNSSTKNRIVMLNADGTVDTSFVVGTGASSNIGFNNDVYIVKQANDGSFLVGGKFTTFRGATVNRIAKISSSGTLDTNFHTANNGFNNDVWTIEFMDDNKPVIGGLFTSYKGVNNNSIIKLDLNGNIDTSFDTGIADSNGYVYKIINNGNNSLFVSGTFLKYRNTFTNQAFIVNNDGSINNSFTFDNRFCMPGFAFSDLTTYAYKKLSDGKILLGNVYYENKFYPLIKLNQDGTRDNSFNFNSSSLPSNQLISRIKDIEIRPNGKIICSAILGNDYMTGWGTIKKFKPIFQLNGDGTLDNSFDSGVVDINTDYGYPTAYGTSIALQEDGKVLFHSRIPFVYKGYSANAGVIRILENGNVDLSFQNIPAGDIHRIDYGISVLSNGKILLYSKNNLNNLYSLILLNSDGTLAHRFSNLILHQTSTNYGSSHIKNVKVIDDKLLVLGNFNFVNGISSKGIVEIDYNGTPTKYFPNVDITLSGDLQYSLSNSVLDIEKYNNKYYIMMNRLYNFNNYPGYNADPLVDYANFNYSIVRANIDGTMDTSFSEVLIPAYKRHFTNHSDASPTLQGMSNTRSPIHLIISFSTPNYLNIFGTYTGFNNETRFGLSRIIIPDALLSTNDNKDLSKTIKLYPNPTKDIVFLESKEIINSLELYDLQGKLLKEKSCNSNKVQVSIQDLPNAVYLVKAKTNKGVETFKVIKN